MARLIRGKVARVLNSREVALNVGQSDGVLEGMRFDVLDRTLHNIEDPDTKEVIGSLNRAKVRVRVSIVEDNISVARTYLTKRVNIGGLGGLTSLARTLGSSFGNRFDEPPKWVDRPQTLKTTESPLFEKLDPKDSYIETGDPVVQVSDDEED